MEGEEEHQLQSFFDHYDDHQGLGVGLDDNTAFLVEKILGAEEPRLEIAKGRITVEQLENGFVRLQSIFLHHVLDQDDSTQGEEVERLALEVGIHDFGESLGEVLESIEVEVAFELI